MHNQNIFDELSNEVNELIKSGSFTAPSTKPRANATPFATMSDEMKAIFTLQEKYDKLIKEKKQEVRDLGLPTEDIIHPLDEVFSFFAPMFRVSTRKIDAFDLLQHDTKALEHANEELSLLQIKASILKRAMTMALIKVIGYKAYDNAHEANLRSDFGIYLSPFAAEKESIIFDTALPQLMRELHVIHLPVGSPLLGKLDEAVAQLNEEHVVCKIGYIPRLATESTKAVFLPKNLDDKRLYEDVGLEASGEMKSKAENRKTEIQKLIDSIVEEGTAHVLKEETKEKVEEEAAH